MRQLLLCCFSLLIMTSICIAATVTPSLPTLIITLTQKEQDVYSMLTIDERVALEQIITNWLVGKERQLVQHQKNQLFEKYEKLTQNDKDLVDSVLNK